MSDNIDASFCIHCGKKLTESSEFCNGCGEPVFKKGREEPQKVVVQGDSKPSVFQKFKGHPKRKLITGIVIALIVTPLVIMGLIGAINVDIGVLHFEEDSFDELNIDLNIYNSIGTTDIRYDDTISNLFEATINVKGKTGADIANAVNFERVNDTGKIIISFDSGIYNPWSWKSFRYNIEILIHVSALVNFDIEGATGRTVLDLEGHDNLNVKNVLLIMTTGKNQFISGTAIGTTIGNVHLQATTGVVDFNFVNAINTTLNGYWADCTTGRISNFFGERTIIDDHSVTLEATTGDIEIQIDNMVFIYNFTWNIEVTTGQIDMYINQEIVSPNVIVDFNIDASTGSIDIGSLIDSAIGIRIHASVTTGDIDIPDSGTFYESAGYSSADTKFVFFLTVTTGNIDFDLT